MTRSTRLLLVACALFASVATAKEFVCKDKSSQCPQWMKNMGGNCEGEDKQYMTINCAETCGFCDDLKAEMKAKEAKEEEDAQSPTHEPDDSLVIVLEADTIDEFIEEKKDEALILLEFFAPWCGHCQQVASMYREAAEILDQEAKAGRLKQPVILAKFDDMGPMNNIYQASSEHRWNFTSYPSMFIIGGVEGLTKVGNGTDTDLLKQFPGTEVPAKERHRYWGGYETNEMVQHMSQLANGGNQSDARKFYHEYEMGTKPGLYKTGGRHESEWVVDIDPDTFEDTVLRSDDLWVVEYYSDKCPVCNSLAPQYIKAAENIQNELKVKGLRYGAVNSRVFHKLAEPYGVTSYPWVTSFYLGKNIEHMSGMGGWESFANWGKRMHAENYKEDGVADASARLPTDDELAAILKAAEEPEEPEEAEEPEEPEETEGKKEL